MARRRHVILVVDDEPDVVQSVQDLLRLEYRVLGATRADEAIKILQEHEVDVVDTILIEFGYTLFNKKQAKQLECRGTERSVARPQDGLIVVAYKAHAERDGSPPYQAYCTSTYRRLEHEDWRVVQHQQTVPLIGKSTV